MTLWLTALKVIPWKDVIEATPAVVQGARSLWKRSQQAQTSEADSVTQQADYVTQELARLQHEARETAALIDSLAQQNAKLVTVVELLRIRTRLLLWAAAVQGAGLFAMLIYLLVR